MKVITLQTQVQVIFGVLDEEGDVIQKHPLNLELPKLNHDSLTELLKKVTEYKDKLLSS